MDSIREGMNANLLSVAAYIKAVDGEQTRHGDIIGKDGRVICDHRLMADLELVEIVGNGVGSNRCLVLDFDTSIRFATVQLYDDGGRLMPRRYTIPYGALYEDPG